MKPINSAALVLAAGSSSRLGHPKQLVSYKGTTLLRYTLDQIVDNFTPTYVLLGAYSEQIQKEVNLSDCKVLVFENWQEGMGSTIAFGTKEICKQQPQLQNLLISVADQPKLSSNFIEELLNMHSQQGKSITASHYSNALGAPTLFSNAHFDALKKLSGETGAKKIIQENRSTLASVDFPGGEMDIDTHEDLKILG